MTEKGFPITHKASKLDSAQLRANYDAHFRNHNNLRDTDSFYAWVFRKLNAQPGRTLLDVACGSGRLLLHARRAGLRTIGIDFSGEAIALERVIEPQSWLILADGQYLPLMDESVDYVTNLGSLEHFVNPDRGIQEMVRVMRPAGRAAVLLPNAFYLADLIWWVWRTGRSASHKQALERFAAFADWRDLLEQNGLSVCKSYKYNFMFPHSKLDWDYYRAFPRKLLNLSVSPVIPFNFSYSFLYLCQRAH